MVVGNALEARVGVFDLEARVVIGLVVTTGNWVVVVGDSTGNWVVGMGQQLVSVTVTVRVMVRVGKRVVTGEGRPLVTDQVGQAEEEG